MTFDYFDGERASHSYPRRDNKSPQWNLFSQSCFLVRLFAVSSAAL